MNAPAHICGHLSHAPLSLRAQRYDWVLEMHTLGFGFREISAALGLGPTAASNIFGRGDPRAPDTRHQVLAMPTRYDVTVRRADGLKIKHTIAAATREAAAVRALRPYPGAVVVGAKLLGVEE